MMKQGTNDGVVLQVKPTSISKVWTENHPRTRYQLSELQHLHNARVPNHTPDRPTHGTFRGPSAKRPWSVAFLSR